MNLHEYQGKELLSRFGIKVQRGIVATTVEEAIEAYHKVTAMSGSPVVIVKAQLHAGGRGKGGGVKVAKNLDELKEKAEDILGMMLKSPQTPGGLEGPGKLVRKILIAEDVYIPEYNQCKEYYMSLLTDRERQRNVIIYSTEGGMDIEAVAENTPDLVFKEHIDPALGLQAFEGRKVAFNLGLSGNTLKDMSQFVTKLYKAFVESDATLLEINPVLVNGHGEVVAVDCKASMDENALFRHKDIEALHDPDEDDPTELEAKAFGLNYVNLDGNVGCMVNGAGLAMATMDIIHYYGGSPANFLDVGGGASEDKIAEGFKIILSDPNVKAILINIFGGIMNCATLAAGIITATLELKIHVPLIVRMEGTNVEEGKKILKDSGLTIILADALDDAAQKAVAASKGGRNGNSGR